jgi:hypothetical protein
MRGLTRRTIVYTLPWCSHNFSSGSRSHKLPTDHDRTMPDIPRTIPVRFDHERSRTSLDEMITNAHRAPPLTSCNIHLLPLIPYI